jgi:F-type H+-transporting ATPase subunit gamma
MEGFVSKKYDRVYTVYNEFKNVATQIVRSTQFLPPVKEVSFKKKKEVKASALNTLYIYEPSQAEIVTELIPKSLKIQFYKAVLDSNASEHGARMTAMDKATDNAKELLKELKLVYNRTRQAAITKEILEIVGGAEALKN